MSATPNSRSETYKVPPRHGFTRAVAVVTVSEEGRGWRGHVYTNGQWVGSTEKTSQAEVLELARAKLRERWDSVGPLKRVA